MDRLACVDVAALPLQILLGAHPAWASLPVAVVEDDRPQALVLFLNGHARRAGVRSGQRYATALALARHLHAGTVSPSQIDQHVRTLTDRLRRYSPHVEPSSDTPGVFWLDAHGLERLYPSLQVWADAVRADLHGLGMKATVAVGFTRFGVYALAMSQVRLSHDNIDGSSALVCADVDEERRRVDEVPLSRLNLETDVRDRLLSLGIDTVGGFLRLPADGIRTRFGAATDALYRLAAGHRWTPLVPVPAEEPYERSVDFDAPEDHVDRLVFVIKRLLDELVATLARRSQAVVEIALPMTLDDRTTRVERVRPAAPTIDVAQLLTLIRLRLDALQLSAGIVTLGVTAETCPATSDQCRLFAEQGRRDSHAANQALARLRAECGEQSVVRARIRDAHLPSARFVWEPLERVPIRTSPRVVAARPLVRRIYTTPVPMPPPRHVQRQLGPYVVSGGWWSGPPQRSAGDSAGGVHRDYYFVHTDGGDLWWLYHDRRRQRMFLQGRVE